MDLDGATKRDTRFLRNGKCITFREDNIPKGTRMFVSRSIDELPRERNIGLDISRG